MERKGGCCLAPRYGAGGQAWQMGRIMLKFRPIAPKPAAIAPVPVTAPPAAVGGGKGKRKAVGGGGGGRRGRKPKKAATTAAAAATSAPVTRKVLDDQKDRSLSSTSSSSSGMTSVDSSPPPPPPATLPLMPVPSVEKEAAVAAAAAPVVAGPAPAHGAGQVVAPQALRPAASWVTVDDVTGTWRDGESPSAAACGGDGDDAPAFVSDQGGRVTCTNAAFSRAVSGAGDDEAATDVAPSASEVPVVLAAKDGAAVPAWGTCAGFTCRVRVRYACPRRGSLVAPCDVWRLDAGGYLWRLDLQATLSLSMGGLL